MVALLTKIDFCGRKVTDLELMRMFLMTWVRAKGSIMAMNGISVFNKLFSRFRDAFPMKITELDAIMNPIKDNYVALMMLEPQKAPEVFQTYKIYWNAPKYDRYIELAV